MNELIFYDLDGTLNKLNNTFDFLKLYFEKNSKIRYLLLNLLNKFYSFIPLSNKLKRLIIINILIYNLDIKKLNIFYKNNYEILFNQRLTKLGIKLKHEKINKFSYLLSGCIEIPGIFIGDFFGFPKTNVIMTKIKIKNDKLKYIIKDTFGNNKIYSLKEILKNLNLNFKLIYYTDDIHTESKLIKYFDIVYLVKGDIYEKIK